MSPEPGTSSTNGSLLTGYCRRWRDDANHMLQVTRIETRPHHPQPSDHQWSNFESGDEEITVYGTISGCACPDALTSSNNDPSANTHAGPVVFTTVRDSTETDYIGNRWNPLPSASIDLAPFLDAALDLRQNQWEHALGAVTYEATYSKSLVPITAMTAVEILHDLGGLAACRTAMTMIWGFGHRDTRLVAAAVLAKLSDEECSDLVRLVRADVEERDRQIALLDLLAGLHDQAHD